MKFFLVRNCGPHVRIGNVVRGLCCTIRLHTLLLAYTIQNYTFASCASPKHRTSTKLMTWRKARFGLFRYNSGYDHVAPTFPRLVGQRFPFPGGPRPREPGSPSAIAGSARATASQSINCPAQTVLGCVANTLVRVDQAAHLGHC